MVLSAGKTKRATVWVAAAAASHVIVGSSAVQQTTAPTPEERKEAGELWTKADKVMNEETKAPEVNRVFEDGGHWMVTYNKHWNALKEGVEAFYHGGKPVVDGNGDPVVDGNGDPVLSSPSDWKNDLTKSAELAEKFKKEQGLTDITDKELAYEIGWDSCMSSLPSLVKPVQDFLMYRMRFEYGPEGDLTAMDDLDPPLKPEDHPITDKAVSKMLKKQEDAFWTSLSSWGATNETMWRTELFKAVHTDRTSWWKLHLARFIPLSVQQIGDLAGPVVQKMDATQQQTLTQGWEIVKTVLKSPNFAAFFSKLFERENAKLKIRGVAKSMDKKIGDASMKTLLHAMKLVVDEPLAVDADEETTQTWVVENTQKLANLEWSAEIKQFQKEFLEFWKTGARALEGAKAMNEVAKALKEKGVLPKLAVQLYLFQFSDFWRTLAGFLDHAETLLEGDLKTLYTKAKAFFTKVC